MKNAPEIKVLLVDDEIEACDNIRAILTEFIDTNVKIVGVAHDTTQAEVLIKEFNPEAVFLDIEMPGENAFQFLERIHPYDFDIVFITAYNEFALKAFKRNAVDYLLKPVDVDELAEAISRLRQRLSYDLIRKNEHQLEALSQIVNREQPKKITLRALNLIEVVDFSSIYSLEGQGSYCTITFAKGSTIKEITTSYTLSFYEELLPREFFRVHKSYVVNCRHIREIVTDGGYSITMKNLQKIPISRRRYSAFIQFIKENEFYRE